jgi:hypothetical protein
MSLFRNTRTEGLNPMNENNWLAALRLIRETELTTNCAQIPYWQIRKRAQGATSTLHVRRCLVSRFALNWRAKPRVREKHPARDLNSQFGNLGTSSESAHVVRISRKNDNKSRRRRRGMSEEGGGRDKRVDIPLGLSAWTCEKIRATFLALFFEWISIGT